MVNREDQIGMKIQQLRKEYGGNFDLDETSIKVDPFAQFADWFDLAVRAELLEPNAMALATVSADLKPSVRMVLLKDFSVEGFSFYSNYHSRKGKELAHNSQAALLFYWAALERQIRIEGQVEQLSRADSERYFASRPRGSQLGAACSEQSAVLKNREELAAIHARLDQEFQQTPVKCPEHWGGYILKANYFEFWQGRENRLHDRICYKQSESSWLIQRLAP